MCYNLSIKSGFDRSAYLGILLGLPNAPPHVADGAAYFFMFLIISSIAISINSSII